MAKNDTMEATKRNAGPMSFEELQRKGPPTRQEIDALAEKFGMGGALTPNEQAAVDEYYATRRRAEHIPTMLGILYPTSEWTMKAPKEGNTYRKPDTGEIKVSHDHDGFYENLEWDEDNLLPKPTKAELQKMIPFVQDILDQESYIKMRRTAYPGEQALIRALWEYVVEGNRQCVDALQARRVAVKKRYPKPENKHWMVQSEEYLRILPNTPQDILREIDEDLAHQIAFNHGVEGEDAQPLSTRKTLEEYAEEALAKRARGEKQRAAYGDLPQGRMGAKITLEDIEEAIEKQERHAKDSVPVAPDEQ